MVKALHFADAHLGVETYGHWDRESNFNSRFKDFLCSFDQLVQEALNEEVDLVIFAGDAYKTKNPTPTQQCEFARRIKTLADAGIKVFLLAGNHDRPNILGKVSSLEIFGVLSSKKENITVCSKPDYFLLETKSGPVQLVGLPSLSKPALLDKEDQSIEEIMDDQKNKMLKMLTLLSKKVNSSMPSVLTGHFSLDNVVLGSEKSMLGPSELTFLKSSITEHNQFDYVALGHIHRHQVLSDFPPIVYSGSIDRVDFGEEKEEKGYVLVHLEKGRVKYEFRPLRTRPFRTFYINLDEDDDTPNETIARRCQSINPDAIVRVFIKLTPQQDSLLNMKELKRLLSAKVHYLAGITKEQKYSSTRSRLPSLTEKLEPLTALEHYLTFVHPDYKPEYIEELKSYALKLMQGIKEQG